MSLFPHNLNTYRAKIQKFAKREIILASGSPRRQKLLKQIGLRFKAIKSNLNEDLLIKQNQRNSHSKLVKILSLSKAISILPNLRGDEIVIGVDTIVVCKNKIIGKPKNKKDAVRKILFLSSREHKVFTGISLIDLKKQKIITGYEMTKVVMKKITNKEAINYVNTKEPLDKAGAYAIQGKGKRFIKAISGDYFNVIGLPVKKFVSMLKSL